VLSPLPVITAASHGGVAAPVAPAPHSAQTFLASVPVPTFVSLCSTRSYERRNQRDTSNYMILVWLWI